MKLRLRSAVAGAATLAITGGMLVLGGVANAAVVPGWEPDPNSVGALSFYNAAGTAITTGNLTDAPMASYFVASGNGIGAGDNKAFVVFATPTQGVNPASWAGVEQFSATTAYPNAAAPASISGLPNAVVSSTAGDGSFADHIASFPNNSAVAGYQNLYEIRIYTTHAGGLGQPTYYSADIQVTGTTWTQVYPAVKVATTTAISASPVSPAPHNSSVTLTANVAAGDASHPAGAVEFFDGATDLGAGTFNAATGVATKAIGVQADGAHSFKAVFTPADTTTYNGSTSSVLSYTVNPAGPVQATTTSLTVNPLTGVTNTNVVLHANVIATLSSAVVTAGTISYFDGATQIATGAPGADVTVSFASVGTHAITAQFVPTDPAVFSTSTSAIVNFVATAPTFTPDPQTVDAVVGAGTMTITTPYGPSNPLHLGTMVLNAQGTQLGTSAAFGVLGPDPALPAYLDNTIKITDTRANNPGWQASVISTNFVSGANAIDAQNVGLITLLSTYPAGNALIGHVTTTDNPGAAPAVALGAAGTAGLKSPKVFASAPAGNSDGTVGITGTMTLVAPSSTNAGTYVATVTFTVA